MEYSYYGAQPQQFQYNGMGSQTLYPVQDSQITPAEAELFRGLNNIGSSFDAYGQFSPANHFGPPSQQPNGGFPQRQASLPNNTQPIRAPKSLSPESPQDEAGFPQINSDSAHTRPRQLSGAAASGSDAVEVNGFDQGRSSSEEKDLNSLPAQDRRKAQNRAAQRAFRERKEKHVKELEAKLQSLSQVSNKLQSDNERLQRELAAASTQNEILRATHKAPRPATPSNPHFQPSDFNAPVVPSSTNGPHSFSPTDFVVATGGQAAWPLKFDVYPNQRGRMLLAGAAWDMIVRDQRVVDGKIDLEDVCKRLKGRSVCDGRGPAFMEEELRQVLDECTLGSDDLL